jgi:alpha-beta hydrolase superfamily lysophospholipase
VHLDLVIPGGIPATFYLPGPGAPSGFRFPEPPAAGNRPPAVLLVHGYTSDRVAMSILARRLARAGYGVLAIDVRGHGTNPRPFAQDPEGANLFEDLSTAAAWLRGSPWVDGSRLAVIGHSMGAGAALRFAERDAGVDAAVMISGALALLGPLRPPNALFLYASGDPRGIRDASEKLVARLAGGDGHQAGSFAGRDAVQAVQLPGNDHTTILWSKSAAREIIAWLDRSFGIEPAAEPELSEPRATPLLLAAALLPITLTGLGLAVGALAPVWPRRDSRGWTALAGLALALLLALPLVAAAPVGAFLGLDVADVLGALLGFAGLLLCAGVVLRGGRLLPYVGGGFAQSVLAGAVGFAVLYGLLAPLSGLTHNLTPGPARAWAGLQLAALLLPFFLGFEHCVRRGSVLDSFGVGIAGRLLTLAVIGLGVALGIVPFVVSLLLVPLALVLILGEAIAVAIYTAGGNRLASATLQAAFMAWLIASAMPLKA